MAAPPEGCQEVRFAGPDCDGRARVGRTYRDHSREPAAAAGRAFGPAGPPARGAGAAVLLGAFGGGDRPHARDQSGNRQIGRGSRHQVAGQSAGGAVMTRTERLLSSTLAEEAATITRESLRPLTGPAEELDFQGVARPAQRWRRPVTMVAAAASVLLVVGLVVMARSLLTAAPPFANVGTATSPPRYYVEIDVNGDI